MTNKVFFLGSGFSKAINSEYPTLKDLTTIVIDNFKKNNAGSAIESHFNEIPSILTGDIEQLFTYLYSNYPWKSGVERHLNKALFKCLKGEVANHLKSIRTIHASPQFSTFLNTIVGGKTPIITLNYDTLIEDFLTYYDMQDALGMSCGNYKYENLIIVIESPFYQRQMATSFDKPYVYNNDYDGSGGAYYQISGTHDKAKETLFIDGRYMYEINLQEFTSIFEELNISHHFENSEAVSKVYEIIKSRFKPNIIGGGGQKLELNKVDLHGSISDNCFEDEEGNIQILGGWESLTNAYSNVSEPYIIPPVLDKSIFYKDKQMYALWTGAYSLLNNADEIYIVGFSFPMTDISIKFLFQSALSKSKATVYVVNKSTRDELKQNYDNVFNPDYEGFAPEYTVNYDYCGSEQAFDLFVDNVLTPRMGENNVQLSAHTYKAKLSY